MAARLGGDGDFYRAAKLILGHNPLGGICGAVCPDSFCMAACTRSGFDGPIRIPEVQATLIQEARERGLKEIFETGHPKGQRVAVVGGGPAGMGAAAVLARLGYAVELFEASAWLGGQIRLIPNERLPLELLEADLQGLSEMAEIKVHLESPVEDPKSLLAAGFQGVVLAKGPGEALRLEIPGDERATDYDLFLRERFDLVGKRVLVVGGGAVAVDCAVAASQRGAQVELVYRRRSQDMPLTAFERQSLLDAGVDILSRTQPVEIQAGVMKVVRLQPAPGSSWADRRLVPEGGPIELPCDRVVYALGNGLGRDVDPATDRIQIVTRKAPTVVEGVALGKNAGLRLHHVLEGQTPSEIEDVLKSTVLLEGRRLLPVPLDCDFFGRKLKSPFLLSAAPHTDGLAQMEAALEAGWAGGVMKTAFDGVPIHIPADYMFALGKDTCANCDNVSEHSLTRVCREVAILVQKWPDRLIMASTGGPMTGQDDVDASAWQSNTQKLESAGVHGIEFSLSCPQGSDGGDGSQGDMVSQNPALAAKVVDWVMAVSNPEIPKLFKLTGAVTSIQAVLKAINEVLQRYPGKKAGVTLANSFPGLLFRVGEDAMSGPVPDIASGSKGGHRELCSQAVLPDRVGPWDEGVVVGLSGQGVLPISLLTLAKASSMTIPISANGGIMDYQAAAHCLALGARTVQCCTLVMRQGLGVIQDLEWGLSHLLESKGMTGVNALIGAALPRPITPFLELSSEKRYPLLDEALCQSCGQCTHCGYQALKLVEKNGRRLPELNRTACVGCSLCAQMCFAGALKMIKFP